MPKIASYNGKVDLIENIKISPMSRAFLFSDSVYEVISFYKNKFIDLQTHLDRSNTASMKLKYLVLLRSAKLK